MSAPNVSRAKLKVLAYQAGVEGESAPDWVVGDDQLMAQWTQGEQAGARGVVPAPKKAPAKKAPVKKAPRPAVTRPGPGSKTPPAPAKTPSPLTSLNKAGARLQGAGDGGGLLLALVVYPIVLSVIKYGAAGPGMWFKAKFLNRTTSSPASLPEGTATGTTQVFGNLGVQGVGNALGVPSSSGVSNATGQILPSAVHTAVTT